MRLDGISPEPARLRAGSKCLDLIERVQGQTSGKLVLGQGSVYPALRDLEREGLLESYEGELTPERGGRPRRYYKLTKLGARAAMEHRTILSEVIGLLPGVA